MDFTISNDRVLNWMKERNEEVKYFKYNNGKLEYMGSVIDISELDLRNLFNDKTDFDKDFDEMGADDIFNVIGIYASVDTMERLEPYYYKILDGE